MRCVLDVNVLVSALLSRSGAPAAIIRLWLEGGLELVVSPRLLAELERVLAYPKVAGRVPPEDGRGFVTLLSQVATLVSDPPGPPTVSTPDPQDDYVVALAEASRALIVSGDRHLLGMASELPVLSPAELLARLSDPPDHR